MHPELLSQLARERLLDLERGREHSASGSAASRSSQPIHAPLRPVGVLFLRIGLRMVGDDRSGNFPISATPAR